MSGSGGGSSRVYSEVGLGSGASTASVCGSLDIETILNSPNATVTRDLKRGAELDVDVLTKGQVTTLVAKDAQGQIAGSLTPPSLITIISCMEKGFRYVAIIVEDVDGGMIRVRIRGKK
jgi:hypothetical protein